MAVHKVIELNSNGSQLEYAGKANSVGAGDAGEFVVLAAGGKLDPTVLPNGIGADAITATAGEALAAGDFVYVLANGTVMKADATTFAKRAMGYVLTSVLNAGSATVFFDESNSALSTLTIGAKYFLSATAGATTPTASTITSGQFLQCLGVATSATSLHVNLQEPIQRV